MPETKPLVTSKKKAVEPNLYDSTYFFRSGVGTSKNPRRGMTFDYTSEQLVREILNRAGVLANHPDLVEVFSEALDYHVSDPKKWQYPLLEG